MPQRSNRLRNSTVSLALQALALTVLSLLPRRRKKPRVAPRRIAASLAVTTLFFAGAAFSAGAGNTVAKLIESGDESAALAEPATSTEEEPGGEEPLDRGVGGPADAPDEAPAEDAPSAPEPAEPAPPEAAPPADGDPQGAPAEELDAGQSAAAPRSGTAPAAKTARGFARADRKMTRWELRQARFRRSAPPVLAERPLASAELLDTDPEVDEPGVRATVWLKRTLPDPTPAARRLKPSFARDLSREAARANVDWALVLGVLRARGERGAVPASRKELRRLSTRLAKLGASSNPWSAVLALEGQTTFADRAVALARYNQAVGLQALIKGLEWAKPRLAERILGDSRVSVYPGGRSDIAAGRVNIRVLVLIAYLAEAHGQVSVSSLISGHRLYARPGVVSAHIYGLAADISVLGGLSILGNSKPGGVTEQAVRNVLLLPAELQPRQVISLLGMGGPSFPMGNHDDHIHVGF